MLTTFLNSGTMAYPPTSRTQSNTQISTSNFWKYVPYSVKVPTPPFSLPLIRPPSRTVLAAFHPHSTLTPASPLGPSLSRVRNYGKSVGPSSGHPSSVLNTTTPLRVLPSTLTGLALPFTPCLTDFFLLPHWRLNLPVVFRHPPHRAYSIYCCPRLRFLRPI